MTTALKNEYLPFASRIKDVIKQTDIEYTFVMSYEGPVKPGQFFEVSLPKYGEAPISVSGIGDGTVDLTIRKVGRVTDEIFENYIGDTLFMRGPYGNGFDLADYQGSELVVIAGGTGLSPVRALVNHFASQPDDCQSLQVICGFKTPQDILFYDDQMRWRETAQVTLTVDCETDEDYCHVGRVTEHIPQLSLKDPATAKAIVVGPPLMMTFSVLGLLDLGFREDHIWVSYERKMCCGIGKCGHCKIGDQYVCVDGPVFTYDQAKDLLD